MPSRIICFKVDNLKFRCATEEEKVYADFRGCESALLITPAMRELRFQPYCSSLFFFFLKALL